MPTTIHSLIKFFILSKKEIYKNIKKKWKLQNKNIKK